MSGRYYETSSGRRIIFEQLHIRILDLEHPAGEPGFIRKNALAELPGVVERLFLRKSGIYITPVPGAKDTYPRYVFMGDFSSLDPVSDEGSSSHLIICWFADDLSQTIPEAIRQVLHDVDWDAHAVDGDF